MEETIEQQASKTILQQPIAVVIGDKEYQVAPPSTATLILVSEAISMLPMTEINPENVAFEGLAIAEHCKPIGDIMAILILGAKGVSETRTVTRKRFFGLLKRSTSTVVDRKAELAGKILEEMTPQQLHNAFNRIIGASQIAFFLGTITSLAAINLLKQTKTKTTVSGQS